MSKTLSEQEINLAYADGYYDGLRHGKQSLLKERVTMPEETQLKEAKDIFEKYFHSQQSVLRGTEQEITVFKQMAWDWFLMGRRSMIESCRKRLRDSISNFNEMAHLEDR